MKKNIQLFKDPLVHFLLAGLVLFVIFNVVSPNKGDLDPNTVVVDREAILIHVQNTSKMFDIVDTERCRHSGKTFHQMAFPVQKDRTLSTTSDHTHVVFSTVGEVGSPVYCRWQRSVHRNLETHSRGQQSGDQTPTLPPDPRPA